MSNRTDKRIIVELNGVWEIEPGKLDSPPEKFTHHIEVPSLVDCASPSYGWREHDFHWYRRSFFADEAQRNRPAFLRVEQSMFGTAVWVNGTFAGESISCYTSQEYRIDQFLSYGAENQIQVRVGQRATLPPESAVGKDQERLSFIPGIWGDVKLVCTGAVRVKLVQTLPRIADSSVDVNVWVENLSDVPKDVVLTGWVSEKISREISSKLVSAKLTVEANSEGKMSLHVPVTNQKLWSPESPFLYVFAADVQSSDGKLIDEERVVFGMREFTIRDRDFLLNGKKIFLRGGNIAFHRFLSDDDRRLLPWNEKWIGKVLIDIPKGYNFNFFRAHLGHMYNRWYDIADEGGILLQDEWQFWGATGTKEQITKEFSEWLKDNWNHPSIVIWDALNESTDEVVQNRIIPEMKTLDPTRPWESYDFTEDHPYIYSLGPVLVDRKFGFTRSLDEIKGSKYPSQVNEYLWWWLDKEFKPSELTKKVVSRWLGEDYTQAELAEHQSFLASELTELFRRLDVKSIQPFVYLSADDGPTSHWFVGDVAELKPKPVLNALLNAFEPFGVSIELWDRHFFRGERRNVAVHIFNDYPGKSMGYLRCGIKDSKGEWISRRDTEVEVVDSSHQIMNTEISLPERAGDYSVCAELTNSDTGRKAVSKKIAHVYNDAEVTVDMKSTRVGIIDDGREILDFLISLGLNARKVESDFDSSHDLLMIVGNTGTHKVYNNMLDEISEWVEDGHAVIFLEPERDAGRDVIMALPGGRKLEVKQRVDHAEGGYDSYVIPNDTKHPVWDGIRKIDLRMFNGGYGGEVVPQFDLSLEGEHEVLARSGLNLTRSVVAQAQVGRGLVVVSSIELGGRLVAQDGCCDSLYEKRPDPIAQRLLLNLIAFYSRKNPGRYSAGEIQIEPVKKTLSR